LDDYCTLAPVFIPDLMDVRTFAQRLHTQRQPWQGEAFGWNAGYSPGSSEPPPGSKMTFKPADFWLGDGAIWFFALMWENGAEQPPVETVYDKNLVGPLAINDSLA
jgi:hypothetical protein